MSSPKTDFYEMFGVKKSSPQMSAEERLKLLKETFLTIFDEVEKHPIVRLPNDGIIMLPDPGIEGWAIHCRWMSKDEPRDPKDFLK